MFSTPFPEHIKFCSLESAALSSYPILKEEDRDLTFKMRLDI